MKKLFNLFAFAIVMLLTSCSPDSPSDVAEKFLTYMNEGKYEKVVDLFYSDPDISPEKLKEDKAKMAGFLEAMGEKQGEDKKFKSLKIESEEIDEEGNRAIVRYSVVLNNGNTDEDKVKLIKNEKGEWMIDFKK